MLRASFSFRWWMYCTARCRTAPLAFSPELLGTMRPSSLMPSLILPRRLRSTSFFCFEKKKKNKVRQPITGSRVQRLAYMVVLSLARPLVCAHRGVSAPARASTRPSPTRPLRLVAFVAVVLVIRHVLWRRTGWWNVGSLGSDARC